ASQALSISQSTVTEALRDLEHDVGFTLVERTARGVELTLKGHQFLSHARKILADVADARSALRAEGGQVTGNLHLG
ncbi:LysR family transcriptional regulator, partial [Acinetobacter baumannii]